MVDEHLDNTLVGIEADDVAIAQTRNRPAIGSFRCHMDGSRHLSGSARHAAIGDERDAETQILEHRQRRRHAVQFRHAIGLGALKAHHCRSHPDAVHRS